jgi:hypothetical protein
MDASATSLWAMYNSLEVSVSAPGASSDFSSAQRSFFQNYSANFIFDFAITPIAAESIVNQTVSQGGSAVSGNNLKLLNSELSKITNDGIQIPNQPQVLSNPDPSSCELGFGNGTSNSVNITFNNSTGTVATQN